MINLRNYQLQSIDKLRGLFQVGHKRLVLCAPTGSGKSIVMLEMIRAGLDKGSKMVFVCERRNLVEQFSRHLDRHGIEHGVLMAKSERWDETKPLQVGTAQTMERMKYQRKYDVAFFDELHCLIRKSTINMLDKFPDMKVVGSTATPFNPVIPKYFTGIANVTTMRELVEEGYLVPLRVFVAHEIDVEGVKLNSKGEWDEKELSNRGTLVVGDIVSDYIKISGQVFGGYRKTICFSAGIAHGKELANAFNCVGITAIQLTCNDTDEYKAEVLAEFAKEDTDIRVLISADLLTRGYDQTDIEHCILARPLRKSFSTHVQMVGRACRGHDGKAFAVVQDHSGNWLRFLDDWEDLYHNGVQKLGIGKDKAARKEPTKAEKTAAVCPECASLWPKHTNVCAVCGHERKGFFSVTTVDGEMREIGKPVKKSEITGAEKERFYRQLVGYSRQNGYKDGWAYHKYQEKYGVAPPWKKQAEKPGAEVVAFIRHLEIKFRAMRSPA